MTEPITSERNKRPGANILRQWAAFCGLSGASELLLTAFFLVCLVILALNNVLHHRFDTDEPQHLHVIWGWTHGLVQYRDLFDNHMPLFQIALAPVLAAIGERATVLYWMRFVLLPAFFISAWCIYRIGAVLFSRRVGIWAVILLGFSSIYPFLAIEFRTDNVWLLFWLLCVLTLVTGRLTTDRCVVAGLLLGFCFGISMKSTLLLVALLVSAGLTVVLNWGHFRKSLWALASSAATLLTAAAVVPALIILCFVATGCWRDFRYCVFDFNILAANISRHGIGWIPIVLFPAIVLAASVLARRAADPNQGLRRCFLLIFCGVYLLVLQNFWRSITNQDYLPIYPLMFLLAVAALIAVSDLNTGSARFAVSPLPVITGVAVVELLLLAKENPFQDQTREYRTMLRDVLTLTNPTDYVLDAKGETVFRKRCQRFVFEKLTQGAVARGLLPDDTIQRCVETRTAVVATLMEERFSPKTQAFVRANYLPVSENLRAAGIILKASPTNSRRYDFDVVIPSRYKIVKRKGTVDGLLDGQPVKDGVFLTSGRHIFESVGPGEDEVALLWEQAVDRQFTPFRSM